MKKKQEWRLYKGSWISTNPVLPGVWQRKEGGHLVRARVIDRTNGHQREIWKALPEKDAVASLKWLVDEKARVRAGISVKSPSMRFSVFTASLFEQKVAKGDIKSAMGRNRWKYTLKHLVAAFGDYYVDQLQPNHIEEWMTECAVRVRAGKWAPTTVNGWLAILKVITKAAKRQLGLLSDPAQDIEYLDTSEHEVYSDEEPNALLPQEVAPFVAKFRGLYPQHFAMFYLGLITGLRPSSLRPLRRRGANADVDWETGRLRVRRSHTVGDEVWNNTKQKRRYTIDLPTEAVDVLQWHVETQLKTPEQHDSDLLFPSITGGFRTMKVLNQPLAEVASELKLGKQITQRALRRTFNDLARAAHVSDLVTRSISGHLTEQMQRHYSTVNGAEQRDALAKVIRLADHIPPQKSGEESGEGALPSGEDQKIG
jgi:integrase